jgi:hypothetical protein
MMYKAVPIKELKMPAIAKTGSYFAIVDSKWPAIVKWDGKWWIDYLSDQKLYGITHILIKEKFVK